MQNEVFFENIQDEIKLRISQAQSSLKIALAYFTDKEIFNLLCDITRRGIKTELVVADEDINFKENCIDFNELLECGGNFFISVVENKNILHNKFCIIDESIVLTGSFNWTYRAKGNMENLIVIKNDIPSTEKFLIEFNKIKSLSTQRLNNRKTFLIKSYIKSFDNHFGGFYSGNIIFYCSEPQAGTTSLLLSLVTNIVQNENAKVAFLSFADHSDVIGEKLLSISSDIPISSINSGSISEYELRKVYEGASKLYNKDIKIAGPINPDLNSLKAKITALTYQSNLKLVVIDNIEKLGGKEFNEDQTGHEKLEKHIIEIRRLAKQLNIPIICSYSMIKQNKSRVNNEISSYDLGVIENHADAVFTLLREEYYNITFNEFNKTNKYFLKALKNRHGSLGKIILSQNAYTKGFETEKVSDFDNGAPLANGKWKPVSEFDDGNDTKLYIQRGTRTNDEKFDDEAPF